MNKFKPQDHWESLALPHLCPTCPTCGQANTIQKAADQGDADAQSSLGWMYHQGRGVEQDFKEAAKWFQKAADQGDADAQLNIGWMYHEGQGVEQDFKEAVKWWQKAADQGDAEAQFNLGVMHEKDKGVEQDFKESGKWWQKAAAQGIEKVKYSLGTVWCGDFKESVCFSLASWKWKCSSNTCQQLRKLEREDVGSCFPAYIAWAISIVTLWWVTSPKTGALINSPDAHEGARILGQMFSPIYKSGILLPIAFAWFAAIAFSYWLNRRLSSSHGIEDLCGGFFKLCLYFPFFLMATYISTMFVIVWGGAGVLFAFILIPIPLHHSIKSFVYQRQQLIAFEILQTNISNLIRENPKR